MSDIHIARPHNTTLRKAKTAAEKVAKDLAEDYDLEWEWEGNVLGFSRSGIEGSLAVDAKSIEINIKLGFLLRPFKDRIKQEMQGNIDKMFGPA